MAVIVPMPPPRSKPSRTADAEAGATILFFTGVRYVRDEEDGYDDREMDFELVQSLAEGEGANALICL